MQTQPLQLLLPYHISEIDDQLNRIAESLQLPKTKRELANQRYKALAFCLENDPFFFKHWIHDAYPQGSFAIRTTVKPYKKLEFDLDFVIHLRYGAGDFYTAMQILDELWNCLKRNETYKDMIERKNRCVRVLYADGFYIDIMAGCQESSFDMQRLKVPDRKTKLWTPSNPLGYASWFKFISTLSEDEFKRLKRAYNTKLGLSEQSEVRMSQDIEKEPPYELKSPLERAVQILKRLRDVYFYDKQDLATSSIILTTLAGYSYRKQLSVFETIDGAIDYIEGLVAKQWNRSTPINVINPANPNEAFSDKWEDDPNLYTAFLQFIAFARTTWEQLKRNPNDDQRRSAMMNAFGESRIKSILEEFNTEKTKALRKIVTAGNAGALFTTPEIKLTTSYQASVYHNVPKRNFGGSDYPMPINMYIPSVNQWQRHHVEKSYDGLFKSTVVGKKLILTSRIRPHVKCDEYRIRIEYISGQTPRAYIISHEIKPSAEIHMYGSGALCLFYPPDLKWTYRTKIAEYTIPWIAEWIVAYELFQLTGKWEANEVKH